MRTGTFELDDRQHLVDGAVELVVDDHVVGLLDPDRLLLLGLAQPGEHLVAGIAPSTQAPFLLLREGGSTKISTASGYCFFTCWAPSSSISSTMSGAVGSSSRWAWGAVVVAEELGPLEEPALGLVRSNSAVVVKT